MHLNSGTLKLLIRTLYSSVLTSIDGFFYTLSNPLEHKDARQRQVEVQGQVRGKIQTEGQSCELSGSVLLLRDDFGVTVCNQNTSQV